jgi:hypothetical protein
MVDFSSALFPATPYTHFKNDTVSGNKKATGKNQLLRNKKINY